MSGITRRDFIKTSLGAAAAGSALLQACRSPRGATSTWSKPLGANDDVRIGVAGIRGKGNAHIQDFRRIPGVRVVALCDPDRRILAQRVQQFAESKQQVAAYVDVRKMIDDAEVDAIVIASPNHWHALMSVWACQAGKDVYVEKPCSHNVWEGRKIVEAARKYGRIVQVGTQSRSDLALREGIKYCQDGNLGKILLVRGLCYKPRGSIGKVSGPQFVPSYIDYDLWTGPAPLKPLMRTNLHYDWHWVWDTGNGDIGNQGIHQMDVCRWAAGAAQLSPRVMSVGGRFGYDDDGETPNTQFVFHDYDEIPILFEVRGLPVRKDGPGMPHYKGIRIGNVIHCEGGYFAGGFAYDNDGKKIKSFEIEQGSGHQANFIEAVRSRRASDLNADILEGHLSSALCHTGNISHLLGREASPHEIHEQIKSEPEALETFERFKEHLAANEVDITKTKATLGPWLKMNPEKERFVGFGAAKANRLLTRDYRQPYVVPKRV
ncbi:MAG TPA: Gfo/Idh/MocA family oxidoreductase [Sumerlaeia bacterium]|nr:Gfo/Idh/MocA family oxidoreductase [Sumerlaeia bacterium]